MTPADLRALERDLARLGGFVDHVSAVTDRPPCLVSTVLDRACWTSDDEYARAVAARECVRARCPALQACARQALDIEATAGVFAGVDLESRGARVTLLALAGRAAS